MLKKWTPGRWGCEAPSPCKKRLEFEKKIIFNKERAILRKTEKEVRSLQGSSLRVQGKVFEDNYSS